MDIYQAIEDRHKVARRLLDNLSRLSEHDAQARTALFNQFKIEMWVHHKTEEAVFYAPLEAHDDFGVISMEACTEHKIVNALIEEVGNTSIDNEQWTAKFGVLKELIEHHMQEEEDRILPLARKLISPEQADELGQKIVARFRVVSAALTPIRLALSA